jgi:hypothetical protein
VDEDIRRRRIVENERLLREANREIERDAREDRERGMAREESEIEFFCACGRPECDAKLLLTLAEYEAAASAPNRFVVAPGHDDPRIERVLEKHETYAVVEKTSPDGESGPEGPRAA